MEKYADLQGIVGKTILTVEEPNEIMIGDRVMRDTNIVLTFSDGTKLKKFLNRGTELLGVDCSALIETVSEIRNQKQRSERIVSLLNQALQGEQLSERAWKRIANLNGLLLNSPAQKED